MKSVLLVDDEEDMLLVYKELLTHDLGDVDISYSRDGIEAFMKTSVEKFDLITLDHKMPRLDGLELLVALRNKPGPNQQTPVIVISGYLPESLEIAKGLGNTLILKKPFDHRLFSEYIKVSLSIK